MPKIINIRAREILDSRGKPTVEAEVLLEGDILGRASVPSGASTGAAEACELRDGDATRYDGLGVQQAVRNVNEILGPALVGYVSTRQHEIDRQLIDLDGTPNKANLGANAILAVSLATARAAAAANRHPLYLYLANLFTTHSRPLAPALPRPMVNMISGGKHAGGNLDFQDVLIIPLGTNDYRTQLEWIVRVYRRLGKLLAAAGYEGYLVGDEGGYGPRLKSNREAVEFVMRAIESADLRPGTDVSIALDVASSHFYREGGYYLAAEQGAKLSSSQMIDRLESWINDFPIVSVEDGLAENDWAGWKELTARLGKRVKLVGDDLFATNEKLLQRGIDEHAGNAILIKVNQIGTLTETFNTMLLAKQHGFSCIVSARSGETEDDFLADLAVGTAADYIKIGSIARSERLAKYNRLLRIADELSFPSPQPLLPMSFYVSRSECSQHEIFPGVSIFTAAGQQMMLSLVEFQPRAIVQPHSHHHEQMGMLLEGELTFTIGGETRTLKPGEMWRIPGGVVHSAVAGDRPVKALDVFHPIREDYR